MSNPFLGNNDGQPNAKRRGRPSSVRDGGKASGTDDPTKTAQAALLAAFLPPGAAHAQPELDAARSLLKAAKRGRSPTKEEVKAKVSELRKLKAALADGGPANDNTKTGPPSPPPQPALKRARSDGVVGKGNQGNDKPASVAESAKLNPVNKAAPSDWEAWYAANVTALRAAGFGPPSLLIPPSSSLTKCVNV